ncbi:MAG: GAF domain-containing protein [Verrucomicrobia bacterium]|nr:GAF domain-containing protein [Verrucomicrobiota bacterium]
MKSSDPSGVQAALARSESRCHRLEQLYRVSLLLHSTLDPKEALERVVQEAVRLVSARSGSVIGINPLNGLLEIQASWGLPKSAETLRLRVGEGITGWVASNGKPVRVGHVQSDPRYVPVRADVQSELAVPLWVAGSLRGVLNVDADRLNAFSEEDQEWLEELAKHAAHVLQNTWLYEQSRHKAVLLESLFNVAQTVNTVLNLDDAFQVIVRESCRLMHARLCSLLMVDATKAWLDLRACAGAGRAYLEKPRLSVEESLVGIVVRRKKPLQIENVQNSSRYQSIEIARQEGLVSLLSVPLMFGGEALGVLNVYKDRPHCFSNEETRILSALAEFSAIALEKARLHERIVDAEERLRQQEKLSALGLLAAEVAHEIRNPLTVIKMLFHSLDLAYDAGDPRARDVEIMRDKIDHLNRIVEQILAFARHAEPVLESVSVNQLLENLSLLVRHKLQHQRVRLIHVLSPADPRITADPGQIEQAFLNLMLNAVEAMEQGGALTLRTSVEPRKGGKPGAGQVVIEFKDSGVGMTAAQRKKVFSSVLSSGKPGGTGLGLAIVVRIVEAHDGRIELRSRPRRGTTFRLLFPGA